MKAAEAVEQAFLQTGLAREVLNVDSLAYASPAFRNLYSRGYLEMVKSAPKVLGWLYDAADKPWLNEKRRLAFDRLNVKPLVRLINEYQPDYVVCTHFLPSEIISWLLCTGRIYTRNAVVVTDFDLHAMWLCHHYSRYFVALEETRQNLGRLGFSADRITVSGIPISPVFAEHTNKEQMREKLGLAQDRPTLLVSAGGFGVGSVESLLANLLPARHALQVVAICGKNGELKQKLEHFASALPADGRLQIRAVGFVNNMHEYMAASDLLLGKPGGLTTSEALAKGLGFVIVNPIPGQEERNADHLLEQGVAIRCNNPLTLSYKIDALLDEPARLRNMQDNARRLSKPDAACTIAQALADDFSRDAGANSADIGHVCTRGSRILQRLKAARRFRISRTA